MSSGAFDMHKPLHVLLVEDSENDAALLEIELERAGYKPACHRVETAEAMSVALLQQEWDVVIADYVMPRFDGLAALALVKEKGLDLPFIIVSGHITDQTAVAAMKAGAHDYVMKDKLARLGPAVERELREAEMRRENRRSEEQLRTEHAFREAIENSVPSGIAVVDLEGRQTYVNPAFCAMVGWGEAELVGAQAPFVYWPPEEVEVITGALGKVVQSSTPAIGLELRFCRRAGERFDALVQITPLKDSAANIIGWVSSVTDITGRKRAEVRLAAEHAITRILANARTLAEAAPGIVQVLLEGLEADLGALWVVEPKGPLLKPAVVELRSALAEGPIARAKAGRKEPRKHSGLRTFLEERRRLNLVSGAGLPGRVWQERRALWLADLAEETGLASHESPKTSGLRSAVAFPIQSGEEFFGVLEFFSRRLPAQDQTLWNMLTAIGSEVGQFIKRRNAEDDLRRAHDELEERVQRRTIALKAANEKLEAAILERKRLEQELLEITEKERRRIGLDLHDDLGQKLSGLAFMTKGLELKLAKEHLAQAQEAAKIHSLVEQAMNHTRELAHDLATVEAKAADLPAALNDLAAHAGRMFEISCRFDQKGDIPPLEPSVTNQLYKIAQEAITNAIKHGKAKRVGISLADGSNSVVLTIQNNGRPFPDLKSRSTGMGLRIMNYRASLIGASLEIKGTGPNGTLVTCSVPVEPRKA